MAHQLPSGRWRVLIRRNGLRESKVFDTEPEAFRWERARIAQLAAACATAVRGPSLADVVRGYLASERFRRKAVGSQNRERSAAQSVLFYDSMPSGLKPEERRKRLAAPDPKQESDRRPRSWALRPVESIDARDLQEYIDERGREKTLSPPHRPISPDSIRLEIRLLSSAFKHAVQMRYRDSNPALARVGGFTIPSSRRRETRITVIQEQRLIAKAYALVRRSARANPSLFPWLEFVRNTGCRPGEAAKIELAWVNLEKGFIDIPRRGTKKRNPRRVLLDPRLVQVLAPQILRAETEGSSYLFFSVSRDGDCVPYRYSSAWRRLREEIGLNVEAHGMRREFISRLFESPASALNDGQIALLVGDVNPASLEPYRYLRSERLRNVHEAFVRTQTAERQRAQDENLREALRQLRDSGVPLTRGQKEMLAGKRRSPDLLDPAGDRMVAEVAATVRRPSDRKKRR